MDEEPKMENNTGKRSCAENFLEKLLKALEHLADLTVIIIVEHNNHSKQSLVSNVVYIALHWPN